MRDGRTGGRTDRRTEWNRYVPPTTSLCGGMITTHLFYDKKPRQGDSIAELFTILCVIHIVIKSQLHLTDWKAWPLLTTHNRDCPGRVVATIGCDDLIAILTIKLPVIHYLFVVRKMYTNQNNCTKLCNRSWLNVHRFFIAWRACFLAAETINFKFIGIFTKQHISATSVLTGPQINKPITRHVRYIGQ